MKIIEKPSSRTGMPIKVEYGQVKVERLITGNAAIRRGIGQVALLSQKIITHYPGAQAGNSMQDSVFSNDEFTDPNVNRDFESVRYCLARVPANYTIEQVQAKFDAHPDSVIYRVLSNNVFDVMTEEQKNMFNRGQLTYFQRDSENKIVLDEQNRPIVKLADKEYLEDRYEVRDKSLTRWLDPNGKRQYRQHYFAKTIHPDIDLRVNVVSGARNINLNEEPQTMTKEEILSVSEMLH